MLAYYEARAPEYDDWYLRRGRYARGPVHDAAWNAELDVAGQWLDGLDIARERLVAHKLRAHIHVRDAWAPADRQVDAVFTGFWLSHVPRERLDAFLAVVAGWLKPGGTYAFIDSRPDPQSGASDHPTPADDLSVRRLDDG